MEYKIKDLLAILLKRWYVVVITVVVTCCLSCVLRNVSYNQVLHQQESLISETYPEDSAIGSYTIVMEFSVPDQDDLVAILMHEDAVRMASVYGIDFTQAGANSSYASMEYVDQETAEKYLFEYYDILQAVAKEMYADRASIQHTNSLYYSYAGKTTQTAELANTVLRKDITQPPLISTLVRSAVFSAVLACCGLVISTFARDLKKKEKGYSDD